MANDILYPSFAGGELSPALYARADLERYSISLKKCRNFMIRQHGGAINRPGMQFIAQCKQTGKAARLIPFAFNTEQTYVLELGDKYLRIHTRGAPLMIGAETLELVTPYLAEDLSLINFVQSADVLTLVHPDYPPHQVKRMGALVWTFEEFMPTRGPFQDVNANETQRMFVSGETGNIRITANFDAFNAGMVGEQVRIEQTETGDVEGWVSYSEYGVGNIVYNKANIYRAVELGYSTGDAVISGNISPEHTTGEAWDGSGKYVPAYDRVAGVKWLYLHSGFGVARITGYINSNTVEASVISRFPRSVVDDGSSSQEWSDVINPDSEGGKVSQSTFNISGAPSSDTTLYSVQISKWSDDAGDFVLTFLGSSDFSVSGSTLITSSPISTGTRTLEGGTQEEVATTVTINYMALSGSSYKWALSAWGESVGYPSAVTYHQQRFVFGGSRSFPQTVWFSESSIFNSFGKSNPLEDSDSISLTLASREVNVIRHLLPLNGLLALTSGSEWLIGNSNEPLAPASISARPQSYRGVGNVEPLVIGNSAIYLQARGTKVRDLAYSFDVDSYTGNDLTILSSHLFEGYTVTSWAYAQAPYSIVWAVRSDGTLLSMTYMKEQQVIAWARHDTINGAVESVSVVAEGDNDVAYVIVKRTIGGQVRRYVERIGNRRFDDSRDWFFVDSGLTYDGRNNTTTTMTTLVDDGWAQGDPLTLRSSAAYFNADMVGRTVRVNRGDDYVQLEIVAFEDDREVVVSSRRHVPDGMESFSTTSWELQATRLEGLDHLEGQTVSVLADSNAVGQTVVIDGSISLRFPAGVVHVGLPIESELVTLPISSTGNTVRAKKKSIVEISAEFEETRGIRFGRDYESALNIGEGMFTEPKTRWEEDWAQPTKPINGLETVNVENAWDHDGSVVIIQQEPLPASVLSIIPRVTIQ